MGAPPSLNPGTFNQDFYNGFGSGGVPQPYADAGGGFDLSDLGSILGGIGSMFPKTGSSSTNSSSSGTSTTQSGSNSSIQSLLSSLSSLFGTSSNTGSTTSNGTTTSGYASPEAQALAAKTTQGYSALANPVNLQPYAAQQTQQINATSGAQQNQADQENAARGLSTSPVAATTDANINAQRVNQTNSLNESLPLLQNQLNLQNLGATSGFLANAPKSTSTTGTGTTNQTGTTSQTGSTTQTGNTNTSQSGSSSTAQQGNSSSNTNSQTGGNAGSIFGGLGTILAGLFG